MTKLGNLSTQTLLVILVFWWGSGACPQENFEKYTLYIECESDSSGLF